jgi:hypothetical protein
VSSICVAHIPNLVDEVAIEHRFLLIVMPLGSYVGNTKAHHLLDGETPENEGR